MRLDHLLSRETHSCPTRSSPQAPSPGIEETISRRVPHDGSAWRSPFPLSQHPASGALPPGGPTPSLHLDSCIAFSDTMIFPSRGPQGARAGEASSRSRFKYRYVYYLRYEKKILRAHGGCLGTGSRRRTRQAAISFGEAQTALDPKISEWGNPAGVMPSYPHLNEIGCEEATRGTETSKYPEEEKSTEIARVAASESAPAQTRARVSGRRCRPGVAGHPSRCCPPGSGHKSVR